jgi:hypothetical protein
MFCYLPIPSSVTKTPNPPQTQRQALFPKKNYLTVSDQIRDEPRRGMLHQRSISPSEQSLGLPIRATKSAFALEGNMSRSSPWIELLGEPFFNRSDR